MKKRNRKSKYFKIVIEKNTIFLLIILLILLIIMTMCLLMSKQNDEEEKSIIVSSNVPIKEQEDILIKEEKEIDSKTSDWNLILVNKKNNVPEDYNVNLSEIEYGYLVDSRIEQDLRNMLSDARKQGLNPMICSAYRTQKKQEELYKAKTNEYIWDGYDEEKAKDLASYWVAIPGTGEHQTGLAVDIVSHDYQILDERQEQTEVQQWLIENSYKYGFVLRYPTEKKDLTMINYEPWHYRYVGKENAKFMREKNWCLEEFIEYLKSFDD